MSKRLDLFKDALRKCEQMLDRHPANAALQSIHKQIEYLVGLEQGTHTDRSRLKNIIIGVLTAREIESLDDNDAAAIFYKVADEARQM